MESLVPTSPNWDLTPNLIVVSASPWNVILLMGQSGISPSAVAR